MDLNSFKNLSDSLLTTETSSLTSSLKTENYVNQKQRNNSGLQRNIGRIRKIQQNIRYRHNYTVSSVTDSQSTKETTTTVDKEPEYYERCPKKQVHIISDSQPDRALYSILIIVFFLGRKY